MTAQLAPYFQADAPATAADSQAIVRGLVTASAGYERLPRLAQSLADTLLARIPYGTLTHHLTLAVRRQDEAAAAATLFAAAADELAHDVLFSTDSYQISRVLGYSIGAQLLLILAL